MSFEGGISVKVYMRALSKALLEHAQLCPCVVYTHVKEQIARTSCRAAFGIFIFKGGISAKLKARALSEALLEHVLLYPYIV